jgi:hypothetical protein
MTGTRARGLVIGDGAGALEKAIADRLTADGTAVSQLDRRDLAPQQWLAAVRDLVGRDGDALALTALVYVPTYLAVAGEQDEQWWDAAVEPGLAEFFDIAKVAASLGRDACVVIIGRAPIIGRHQVELGSVVAESTIIGLARSLAIDVARDGVRVNVVTPNSNAMTGDVPEVPLGRQGTAADMAGVVSFLCSPAASYITGQCIYVDGGRSLNRHLF